jgi:hypothetical protein
VGPLLLNDNVEALPTRSNNSSYVSYLVYPNLALIIMVKRERSDTPSASSTRAKTTDLRPQSPGVYVVSHIMARSLEPGFRDGVHDYQYLVRWQGYGPEDDTWEFRPSLMVGASNLVQRFDLRGGSLIDQADRRSAYSHTGSTSLEVSRAIWSGYLGDDCISSITTSMANCIADEALHHAREC